jgi:hypothetical protein
MTLHSRQKPRCLGYQLWRGHRRGCGGTQFFCIGVSNNTHLCNKKKRDAELVVAKQTLAKSIMSIGMTKVTNESQVTCG